MKKLPVLSLILSAVGAAGGYAYYYFIGCASGTCPLSSNAWIMTGYGAMVGATLSPFSSRNKRQQISEVRDDSPKLRALT